MLVFNNVRESKEESKYLTNCRLLTSWAFFPLVNGKYVYDSVDEAAVKKCIDTIGPDNRLVVLDLEAWPLQGTAEVVQETMDKMLVAVDLFRKYAPGIRLGIYPVPPRSNWSAVFNYYKFKKDKTSKWWGQAEATYKWWHGQNKLYMKGRRTSKYTYDCLTDRVDFICPDIYAHYSDETNMAFWPTYGREHIKAARLHRKNVYPYISPYIGGKDKELVPTKHWVKMLDTCKRYADGAIIYTCVNLDPSIEWWVATKEWMEKNKE